jgi:hypothetical protein
LFVSLAAQAGPPPTPKKKVSTEQQLRETVADLQNQLRQVQDQLSAVQQKMNQLESTTTQTQSTAQTAVSTADQNAEAVKKLDTNVAEMGTKVTGLSTAQSATSALVEKTEKKVADLEEPVSVRYKGVKLTPGGYVAFVQIFRNRNANADSGDSYGAVPLNGSANSNLTEWRTSGRATRLSLRADATVFGIKTMGYIETDFLGSSPTGNETQTNTFAPRLRLAFGNLAFPGGWSMAAGQNWTLLQTTRKGIDPRTEWTPLLINNSMTPGMSYARLGAIRVVKAIGAKSWFGFSVENPTTVTNVQCIDGAPPSTCNIQTLGNIQGLINSTNTTSPSNSAFAPGQTPSTSIAPDLAFKFAIEPGWGHFEVKAVGRFFRDRVYPAFSATPSTIATINTGTNKTTLGGGIGLGAIMPVSKKVDIVLQGLAGIGIGRYGSTGGPDVTIRPDGTLVPIRAFQGIIGIETHPNPKTDFVVYFGDEYYGRAAYNTTTPLFGATPSASNTPVSVGYGSPNFQNGGCNLQFPASSTPISQVCQSSSQNRYVWAVQPVFWYRFWKGKEGSFQYGLSYAYVYRKPWAGVAGNPTGSDNIVMNTARWYLP